MPLNRRADTSTPDMPVQFADPEPSAYDRGDGLQWHMAMDEVEIREPLGAVLRDDNPRYVRPHMSVGPLLDYYGVPREDFLRPSRKSFLARTWDIYHEWIGYGFIIFIASLIIFAQS